MYKGVKQLIGYISECSLWIFSGYFYHTILPCYSQSNASPPNGFDTSLV